jgi:chromosome segregation and condensation protein ScpB
MNLESIIEGILFYKAEPMKKEDLANFLNIKVDELSLALVTLRLSLSGHLHHHPLQASILSD